VATFAQTEIALPTARAEIDALQQPITAAGQRLESARRDANGKDAPLEQLELPHLEAIREAERAATQ
jgi:hypothetical protein